MGIICGSMPLMARRLAVALLAVAVFDAHALHASSYAKVNSAGVCPTGWSLITSEAKCKAFGINSATHNPKTCQWGAAANTPHSNFRASTDFGARPHGCWQATSADGCVYWNPNAADAVATFASGRSICAESSPCGPYGCSHRAEYTDRSSTFATQLASFSSSVTADSDIYAAAGALTTAAKAVATPALAAGAITSMTTPIANTTDGGYKFQTHGTNAAGHACQLTVEAGIQICIPCDVGRTRRVGTTVGGSSDCPFGIALVAVD